MSLEETELNVGGVKLKGVYIALVFTIVSTIGGGIWTASQLYGRLEGVEENAISNSADVSSSSTAIKAIQEELALVDQQLRDNDISGLQGKLAELSTNLQTILQAQTELLLLKERVVESEKSISDMKAVVASAEITVGKIENFEKIIDEVDTRMARHNRESDDLWRGMDDLANPLQ